MNSRQEAMTYTVFYIPGKTTFFRYDLRARDQLDFSIQLDEEDKGEWDGLVHEGSSICKTLNRNYKDLISKLQVDKISNRDIMMLYRARAPSPPRNKQDLAFLESK